MTWCSKYRPSEHGRRGTSAAHGDDSILTRTGRKPSARSRRTVPSARADSWAYVREPRSVSIGWYGVRPRASTMCVSFSPAAAAQRPSRSASPGSGQRTVMWVSYEEADIPGSCQSRVPLGIPVFRG